jgi:hypothetical protein
MTGENSCPLMNKSPALKKYLNRIGIEDRHVIGEGKWQITEQINGYPKNVLFVFLKDDGSISCRPRSSSPNKEEAAAIKEECKDLIVDKAILTNESAVEALIKQKGIDRDRLYIFYSVKGGKDNVIMCQERRENENGGKSYLPWTYTNEGSWQIKEPRTKLPFYKPKKRRSSMIMIHEGAKAAHWAEMLCNSEEPKFKDLRANHPWYEELKQYEHWGIIGGAHAPDRADYSELKAVNVTQVVHFCDNDDPGKAILKVISREYGRKFKGIRVEETIFPPGWDIADEFPRNNLKPETYSKLWSEDGDYIGPTISDMIIPATYATRLEESEDGKKMIPVINSVFAEEWRHCINPDIYCHTDAPWIHYDEEAFNDKVAPYSDVKRTSELLKKLDEFKVDSLGYDPTRPSGIVLPEYSSGSNVRLLNTHMPTRIKSKKGDIKPWTDYMEYMIPIEEDREHVYKWCATLIARPDIRMSYSMILISSAQGVGKTTLGEKVLAPLVGRANHNVTDATQIVESQFNGWVAHKRLIIVNEIYEGHSSKAYNRLKTIITDDDIQVNEKFMKPYSVKNWAHIIANSNSDKPLKIEDEDRRWLIPSITEEKKPPEFWDKFNNWLEKKQGLSIIKYWAEEYVKNNGAIRKSEPAPFTAKKRETINAGQSPGQQAVAVKLQFLSEKYRSVPIVVLDSDLVEYVSLKFHQGRRPSYLEKASTLRKLALDKMKTNGEWFVSDHRVRVGSDTMAHVITNDKNVISKTWLEMQKKAKYVNIEELQTL